MPYKEPTSPEALKSLRAARRKHYRANPGPYRQRARERQTRIRRLARDAKSIPCMDCRVEYPWYIMDFDHRPGEVKLGDVCSMANAGVAEQRILDEIAKCDVVCSNCHRQRTYDRRLATDGDDMDILI